MKARYPLVLLAAVLLFWSNSSAQNPTDQRSGFQTKQNKKMESKNFVLLSRFSTKNELNAEQLKVITRQWQELIKKWTLQGKFVSNSVIPQQGFEISGEKRKLNKKFVETADGLKVVSLIQIKAESIEEALELAGECPILSFGGTVEVREIEKNSSKMPPAENTDQQIVFIDKFEVPLEARQEFLERMEFNIKFIEALPGFIEHKTFEEVQSEQTVSYVTIAVWRSAQDLENAKIKVQAEYKKQGFDLPEMLKRLNIKFERAIYKSID